MKVEIAPKLYPTRGSEVLLGNVYANNRPPAFRHLRIVVGLVNHVNGRNIWSNVVLIHVDDNGDVIGASRQPRDYVKNHWDLVGRVKEMPTLKVEWIKEKDRL